MQGRRGGELLFVPEIEKFARANRKEALLAKEAERLARIKQESIETVSTSSQEFDEEHFEMGENPPPPPPPRRTLGDYGQWNDGQLANLGFQPANPVNFDIKNSVINALKEDQYSGAESQCPNLHLGRFYEACDYTDPPGVTESQKRLRLFKFSLTGRAKDWLDTLPSGTINTWQELERKFLERYFPIHKFLERRADIVNFEQGDAESLYDAWERFKLCLKKCLKHGIDTHAQMQHFTQGLRAQTRMLLDASAGGSLKNKNEQEAMELIESMAQNEYRANNDRGAKKKPGMLELEANSAMLAEQKLMNNKMEALVQHFTKASSAQHQSKAQVSQAQGLRCDFCKQAHENGECMPKGSEEAKYMANFRRSNPYNQGWGENQNQSPNLPQQSRASPLEDTLTQFIKMTQSNFETMRINQETSNENHKASIKNLEVQIGQLSKQMASSSSGGFEGNTCENPRKESCNAIELRSRVVPTPPAREPRVKRKVEGEVEKEVSIEEKFEKNEKGKEKEEEVEKEKKSELEVEVENECDEENEGEVENERKALRKEIDKRRKQKKRDLMNDIGPQEVSPYDKLPYPRAPKKEKNQEEAFGKFMKMYHSLQVDIPFADVLEQMPLFAKFMKEVLTKKRKLKEDEPVLMNEECSATIQSKLPQKKKDPGSFTIPISIGNLHVGRALCDLGASINLMPLSLMKRIPGAVVKPIKMQITLADRSITHPYGILQDVLVRCAEFVFPVDFVILDMDECVDTPVLLGRPFLATGRALIDVAMGELMLRLEEESVSFKVFEGMEPYKKEKPRCFQVEASEEVVKDSSSDEAPMPTVPELKELPPNWKYVFLNEDSKDPVIVSSSLTPLEEEVLLKKFKEGQGGLGFDLNGVIPVFCVTPVKNEEEPNPGNVPLEPPNSSLEELVRKEKKFVKKSKKVLPKAKKTNRNKGENKLEEFMSPPVLEKVLCVAQEAILVEKLKRSRVESKMKYPP
ncbi:hypothetical protein P8452_04679 [Trifolium repens]|nr:hypothetical protein P8452_04679 [Trifolium repens]